MVRDVGLAEELAQEALVAALERWPGSGVPDNPGAWLMATAKHHAIDHLRRSRRLERKHEELGREIEGSRDMTPELEAAIDENVGDDLLRLVFVACHPVLSTEARVALTLRLLGGLTTEEIARAFLVPEATVAQRIVRAKRTLAEARGTARRHARPVQIAGRDRRLSCARADRRGDGLAAHRGALRRARAARAIARGRAQPRGRRRHGVRCGRRPRAGRRAHLGTIA